MDLNQASCLDDVWTEHKEDELVKLATSRVVWVGSPMSCALPSLTLPPKSVFLGVRVKSGSAHSIGETLCTSD